MMAAGIDGRGARMAIVALLGGLALWNAGAAVYIMAKAELAQVLLEGAWQQTLDGATRVRPWNWADTWPIMRITLPGDGETVIVLEGASGRNLAFGPAHLSSTPLPGESGNSVIIGHRDTHFSALETIAIGDVVAVERPGKRLAYRIKDIAVVHETNVAVLEDVGTDALTLITCYPFDAVNPGTSDRYVVMAERVRAQRMM